jgi:hypothetical protein
MAVYKVKYPPMKIEDRVYDLILQNDTNNAKLDEEQNRMNVTIKVVPTNSVEFIAIDFVVTNSGVQFV